MPEEVNRVVTDRVADLLLCTSEDAVSNLAAEGISGDGVQLVGNTMIDSLFRILDGVDRDAVLAAQEVKRRGFVLVTLHRPGLVDDRERLGAVIAVLGDSADLPVLFPAHPRTTARLADAGIEVPAGLRMVEPMDYDEFIALEAEARLVITDSGACRRRPPCSASPASPTGLPPSGRSRSSAGPTSSSASTRTPCARPRNARLRTISPPRQPEFRFGMGKRDPVRGPRSRHSSTAEPSRQSSTRRAEQCQPSLSPAT
jgi:hypothetical protein